MDIQKLREHRRAQRGQRIIPARILPAGQPGASAPRLTDSNEYEIVLDSHRHGFGDAIVFSWACEGAKLQGRKIAHFAKETKADLLHVFGQYVTDSDRDVTDVDHVGYFEEMRLRGKISALENRASFLKVREPVRPLPAVSGEVNQWAAEQMKDNGVLLFPRATRAARIWPTAYWIELATLLQSRGYNPFVVVWNSNSESNHDQIGEFVPNVFVGLPWEHTVALMQAAQFCAGNNSGCVHVSGTLDRPTFVLAGLTTRESLVGIPSMIHVSVTEAECDCVGCYYARPPFRRACEMGCEALHLLRPRRVMAEIERIQSAELALEQLYERCRITPSDINEHCEILRYYASRSCQVVEFGTRDTQISTIALLAGRPVLMRSYDVDRSVRFKSPYAVSRTDYQLIHGDSRTVDIPECDLLFIDTAHTYEVVAAELQRHYQKVRRWIAFHDTAGEQYPAYRQAIEEFIGRGIFDVIVDRPNQSGLMVLERRT